MHKYVILLKDGAAIEAECRWLTIDTVFSLLSNHQPFIQIGYMVFAKDAIAMIKELTTEEKEN